MSLSIKSGWISEARKVISPNFDMRPAGTEIDLLVIHGISLPPGEFGGGHIEDFFTNNLDENAHPYFFEIKAVAVSSHFLIARRGKLVQFVSLEDRAWHSGDSSYCGRGECNDYSIGIELEGTDDTEYTSQQYDILAQVTTALLDYYPLMAVDRIVGHSDISPGRKSDPGPAFSFSRLKDELAAIRKAHTGFSSSVGR